LDTLTVDLSPAKAAALVRWHLGCGDDRFLDTTEHVGLSAADGASPAGGDDPTVILLQSVRALPRAGLCGCSIIIHNVTGVTRVSFAAAEDNPWAAVTDSAVLRDKLSRAFEAYKLPDPEVVAGRNLRGLARSIADHRPAPIPVAPLHRRLRLTLDLPLFGPVPLTPPPTPTVAPRPARRPWPEPVAVVTAPLSDRLGLTLGLGPLVTDLAAPRLAPTPDSSTTPDFLEVFDPTLELAHLLANDVRTEDDLPDRSGDIGPITAIEALSAAQVRELRYAARPSR